MNDFGTRLWNSAGALALLALLAAALLGMTTCTQRTWAFEDACRRAGGIITEADQVTASRGMDKVCARVVQSPITAPIALPDYRR